ncbi:MAG: hypothetical protein ACLPSW_16530, partial [Roseiarcus sp.]
RLVAGEHVTVSEFVVSESDAYQIEISVGHPPAAPRAPKRLILFADGWRVFLGSSLPPAELPRSGVTLGPYLGACFAAGEVFKLLRGMKEGRGQFIGEQHELYLSLWSTETASSWDGLSRDPNMGSIKLPPLYFAGAGAVAEAAALAIAGLPDAGGYMTVVESWPRSSGQDSARAKWTAAGVGPLRYSRAGRDGGRA